MKYNTAVRAMKYCLRRGMTKEQIKTYHVCVEMYSPRVWFPYWDCNGNITYWFGRTFNDGIEPKILNSDSTDLPLFGRHTKIERNEAVLVEGMFDHFSTPSSYALLGSNVTGSQVLQLKDDDVKRIFLVLDSDAGEKIIFITRKLSRFGFSVWPIIIVGNKKDPAEIGRSKMTDVVDGLKARILNRPQTLYVYPT